MLNVAQALKDPILIGSDSLPKYEFVQDIEETPDVSIQDGPRSRAQTSTPVDSFWFFEMDTPKPMAKALNDNSHLGASAMVEQTSTNLMEPVPIAAPGSFQLFMPDPEMMDRLGAETVEGPMPSQKVNDSIPIPILHLPSETSSKEPTPEPRARRSKSIKSVVIADPPVSGQQSPPRSISSTLTRIVSYQRPRERSKSRNSRLARAQQPVNATYAERKTLENLSSSMRSASELLERRRAEGASRYADMYPPNPLERGRAPLRTGSSMQAPFYRSMETGSTQSGSGPNGGNGLWGLFDMAQSWITGHKSRRDRSEEVSRSLIRKSRNV